MTNDDLHQQLFKLVINRIQRDFATHNLTSRLYRKSHLYLTENNLSTQDAIKISVSNLPTTSYFRGPHDHHWLQNVEVFEFIISFQKTEIYLKFGISEFESSLESFHPAEKSIDNSWIQNKDKEINHD